MYLTLVNCTLKNDEDVKFNIICILQFKHFKLKIRIVKIKNERKVILHKTCFYNLSL